MDNRNSPIPSNLNLDAAHVQIALIAGSAETPVRIRAIHCDQSEEGKHSMTATEITKAPVLLPELADKVKEINAHLVAASKYDDKAEVNAKKADDNRRTAAVLLAQCKERCDATEGTNFKSWYNAQPDMAVKYEEATKLAKIGKEKDAEAALEDFRARTREQTRAYRKRLRLANCSQTPCEQSDDEVKKVEKETLRLGAQALSYKYDPRTKTTDAVKKSPEAFAKDVISYFDGDDAKLAECVTFVAEASPMIRDTLAQEFGGAVAVPVNDDEADPYTEAVKAVEALGHVKAVAAVRRVFEKQKENKWTYPPDIIHDAFAAMGDDDARDLLGQLERKLKARTDAKAS